MFWRRISSGKLLRLKSSNLCTSLKLSLDFYLTDASLYNKFQPGEQKCDQSSWIAGPLTLYGTEMISFFFRPHSISGPLYVYRPHSAVSMIYLRLHPPPWFQPPPGLIYNVLPRSEVQIYNVCLQSSIQGCHVQFYHF